MPLYDPAFLIPLTALLALSVWAMVGLGQGLGGSGDCTHQTGSCGVGMLVCVVRSNNCTLVRHQRIIRPMSAFGRNRTPATRRLLRGRLIHSNFAWKCIYPLALRVD